MAGMNGHGDATAVGVPHDVVTATYPGNAEARSLQRLHDLAGGNGWHRGHQATSRVISSGVPISAIRAIRASRKSASASSGVAPSPTAPAPGRTRADAHQTPSSS